VYRVPAHATGDRAPAVTMTGWYGTALGCRRRGPAGYRLPHLATRNGVDV